MTEGGQVSNISAPFGGLRGNVRRWS